jgi:hypothetical protein
MPEAPGARALNSLHAPDRAEVITGTGDAGNRQQAAVEPPRVLLSLDSVRV